MRGKRGDGPPDPRVGETGGAAELGGGVLRKTWIGPSETLLRPVKGTLTRETGHTVSKAKFVWTLDNKGGCYPLCLSRPGLLSVGRDASPLGLDTTDWRESWSRLVFETKGTETLSLVSVSLQF